MCIVINIVSSIIIIIIMIILSQLGFSPGAGSCPDESALPRGGAEEPAHLTSPDVSTKTSYCADSQYAD